MEIEPDQELELKLSVISHVVGLSLPVFLHRVLKDFVRRYEQDIGPVLPDKKKLDEVQTITIRH